MLVLSRRRGEWVIIETPLGEMKIQITQVVDNKVQLGIDAPQNFQIFREEIQHRKYQVQRKDPDGWPKYDQEAIAHRAKADALRVLKNLQKEVPGYEYRIIDQDGNILEIEGAAAGV